jgi:hypothetical protein
VGILAALLLIPLVTVFLGAGALFLGLSFLPVLPGGFSPGNLIAEGLYVVYKLITLCLDLFSRLPGLYVAWKPMYWLLLSILLVPVGIEWWMQKKVSPC